MQPDKDIFVRTEPGDHFIQFLHKLFIGGISPVLPAPEDGQPCISVQTRTAHYNGSPGTETYSPASCRNPLYGIYARRVRTARAGPFQGTFYSSHAARVHSCVRSLQKGGDLRSPCGVQPAVIRSDPDRRGVGRKNEITFRKGDIGSHPDSDCIDGLSSNTAVVHFVAGSKKSLQGL